MVDKIGRELIRPAVVPVAVAVVTGALIIGIGEALLHLFSAGTAELTRRELWFGVLFSLAVLGIGAFVASRPPGSMGPLDRELAIGHRSMFSTAVRPPADAEARNGPLGTVADIKEGDVLYARSGRLASVVGVLPGGEEHGVARRGFIYAAGLHGASDELWIPVEAVTAVYPQSRSVFLGIKGDETEAFGWHRPPAHLSRQPRPEGPRLR